MAKETKKDLVSSVQQLDGDDLEKITVLAVRLLADVKTYCGNVAALAPLARHADATDYNRGFADGRTHTANSVVALIDDFIAAVKDGAQKTVANG